ncbi:MAG TPA: YciI-like protein [Candidatus Cybelea sp.]|nr:YciI-like protein [Candidatus Cybelea sp.]
MHYLLFYEVVDDYAERRAEFRQAHLAKAWRASARGELVLGGALADPIDGAVLLFHGESAAVAEDFARADPYVTGGLVKRWHVREWNTVVGEGAANPVKPNPEAKSADEPGRSVRTRSSPERANAGPSILRLWTARTTAEKFDDYVRHVTGSVFPALGEMEGYGGGYLLRRERDAEVEIVVLTLWESMEAIEQFAGRDPNQAVVEPRARAVLTTFDEFVKHYEIVDSPAGPVHPKS